MKREELEHVIRAAADIAGEDEIVIVGSQAILGRFPDAPQSLLYSQEADVFPRRDPAVSEAIDAALGDGSQFHAINGYYAHGVGPETAKAPKGWEERLIPVRVAKRQGSNSWATGWCLEPHDLVLSKCVAGRQRDVEFATCALEHDLVDLDTLLSLVPDLPVGQADRSRVEAAIRGIAARLAPQSSNPT